MTRVILTGGTGFIAAHILDTLLKHGHSVVATVRSHEKGQWILDKHSGYDKRQLDYAVVPDISQSGAYDAAVVSSPPFEAVIYAASPYHFNARTEAEIDDLITTAINGTTGILQAVKAKAPSVRRMVVTSSFAAIVDPNKPVTYTYSERDWDPITREEASTGGGLTAYRCSKTLAERAAWDFIEKEKPNFTLTTVGKSHSHALLLPLTLTPVQPTPRPRPSSPPPSLPLSNQHLQHPPPRPPHRRLQIQTPSNRQPPLGRRPRSRSRTRLCNREAGRS